MALFKFQNLNKYGTLRTRIIYSPTSQLIINPRGLGDFINVQKFRYEYHHAYMNPQFQIKDGEKYIIPGDIKVHPETTFLDIKWIKPKKLKKKLPPETYEFKSSSSDSIYQVKKTGDKYQCNCPGYWRSYTRECKHIKQIKNKK